MVLPRDSNRCSNTPTKQKITDASHKPIISNIESQVGLELGRKEIQSEGGSGNANLKFFFFFFFFKQQWHITYSSRDQVSPNIINQVVNPTSCT